MKIRFSKLGTAPPPHKKTKTKTKCQNQTRASFFETYRNNTTTQPSPKTGLYTRKKYKFFSIAINIYFFIFFRRYSLKRKEYFVWENGSSHLIVINPPNHYQEWQAPLLRRIPNFVSLPEVTPVKSVEIPTNLTLQRLKRSSSEDFYMDTQRFTDGSVCFVRWGKECACVCACVYMHVFECVFLIA